MYTTPWTPIEALALRSPPPRGCVPDGPIEIIVSVGPITFARFEGAVWVGVHADGEIPSCDDDLRRMSWIPSSEAECAETYEAPADTIDQTIGLMSLPLRLRSLRHGAVVACVGQATGRVWGWVESYRGPAHMLDFARKHGSATVFRNGRASRFSVVAP